MLSIYQAYETLRLQSGSRYESSELRSIGLWLMEELWQCTRTTLLLKDKNTLLSAEQETQWRQWAEQIADGIPIQYVLGKAPFGELTLYTAPGVLIPRPETEELVTWIAEDYCHHEHPLCILDVGTGSGCIAIALAKVLPCAELYALEYSSEAISVAQKNFDTQPFRNRLHLLQGDIFNISSFISEIPPINLVVSNPPYIMPHEAQDMPPEVLCHEPHTALFVPAEDPLCYYRAIAQFAKKQGTATSVYTEINPLVADETRLVMLSELPSFHASLRTDLSGKQRMLRLWQ